jgi:hypothetical protein
MTLLPADRSDLVRTIEDEDTVEADDASSDEEEAAQPKKNKAARKAKKDFESGNLAPPPSIESIPISPRFFVRI